MMVEISIKKTVYWLYGLVFALNTVGFAGRVIEKLLGYDDTELVRLFDVAKEANVTSWFSSFLLSVSALLLFLITKIKFQERDTFSRHWAFIACVFLYLSLDESARIHEATIEPVREFVHASGLFYYSWVIIAIPVIMGLALIYRKFVFSLPIRTRNQFILAAIIFMAGAIGFEMLGGLFHDVKISGVQLLSFTVTLEELFENLGVVVFISALLAYIKSFPDWSVIPIKFS